MPRDLTIIKKLEKKLGKTFEPIFSEKIGWFKPSIQYEINDAEQVIKLRLHRLKLQEVPLDIAELLNLQRLDLSDNQLSTWPVEMAQLVNLQQLDLRRNQLTTWPVEMAQLVNLQQLDLRRNQLTTWPVEMAQLLNLQQLYLSYNQLTTWPVEMAQLLNLQRLDLSDNQLTTWPVEMARLLNLQRLDLSDNQLTTWPVEMAQLLNLQLLYLSDNQLTTWPVEMAQLVNLQQLDLRRNQLTTWPVEMAQLKIAIYWKYKYTQNGIFLEDNPLENPPPEIIKQGRTAILEYFNAGEKQRLNEVKVLFIGDGGAGKTSLIKQLQDQQFNPNESQTKGIEIKEWEVVDISHYEMTADQQTIKAHLWDFGGQEIMHATHQFFLSKRSLYLLVLDGRKDDKIEYWLKYIESFGGDSPILVVLNKIDQNPAFEVNRKFLREKYQGIQDFYRLSCESHEGIEAFRTAFQRAVSQVEIRHIYWPITWFNVKTRLEQLSTPYIDYENYTAICKTAGVAEKKEENLLEYLCNLGVILHFKELLLENTHVLEPKWVTKAIYNIINARQVTDKQGILEFSDLEAILQPTEENDYHYPRDQYPYIVGLMKKFELCYALDEHRVLIPDLLPVEEPEFSFEIEEALQFRIDYPFLPKSVMPRFIVNMHPDIQGELRWRTGVVLKEEKLAARAVVKSDDDARQLFIAVTGSQRRDYFAIILKTLRTIHNSFEKLTLIERICLPDNPGITVDLEHLYNLEKMGESTLIPEGSHKKYRVRALLGTVDIKQDREFEKMFKRVKEIHAKTEQNHDEEIYEGVKEISTKMQESPLQKTTDSLLLQPNLFGVGFNFNNLFRWFFNKQDK